LKIALILFTEESKKQKLTTDAFNALTIDEIWDMSNIGRLAFQSVVTNGNLAEKKYSNIGIQVCRRLKY
jgi:hypothetical protein